MLNPTNSHSAIVKMHALKYLFALLAGIAMPFSFAPYSLWLLPFLSIAVLYSIVKSASGKQAWGYGLVFGAGYFLFGVYWIFYSVRLFGGAAASLAVAMTVLFAMIMALFPALVCLLHSKIRAPSKFALSNAFVFAGLWVVSELLRGWIFGGFPWLLVGYTQIDSVFSGYAPVLGVFTISWIVVFIACSLCVLVTEKNRVTRMFCALCTMLLAVSAALLAPIVWTQGSDEVLNLRLVQGNIKQELKFSRERLDQSLETYQALTRSAPDGTQLVIWPETAIPTLFANVDEAIAEFVQEMSLRGVEVLSGGFYRDAEGKAYNSVRQLGGDKALYSKTHLVPFGEFMPFRTVLEPIARFVQIPMSDLSAAPTPAQALKVRDWHVDLLRGRLWRRNAFHLAGCVVVN